MFLLHVWPYGSHQWVYLRGRCLQHAVSATFAPHSQGWHSGCFISVCVCGYSYMNVLKMVYSGERRRNKGLITFSSLKQQNGNQWLCTDQGCTNCGQPHSLRMHQALSRISVWCFVLIRSLNDTSFWSDTSFCQLSRLGRYHPSSNLCLQFYFFPPHCLGRGQKKEGVGGKGRGRGKEKESFSL